MATDSDFIKYSADVLRLFADQFYPGRVSFPGSAPPPNNPPPQSDSTTTPAGIRITATGLTAEIQPKRFCVAPGTQVSFTGGRAKRGMAANNQDAWGANIPYHVPGGEVMSPVTLAAGECITIAKARVPGSGDANSANFDPDHELFLEEATLVETTPTDLDAIAVANSIVLPAPLVRGAILSDAQWFDQNTAWCPETREGWAARHGHPRLNCTPSAEPGYGGVIAERTSLGALLLVSDLPDYIRKGVLIRMLMMAEDLERFGCPYGGNGGHGNGRYILWLLRRLLKPTAPSVLHEEGFSEYQQTVQYTGPGNLNGLGFQHTPGLPVDMGSDYFKCCTYNRTAPAALVANVIPGMNPDREWVQMCRDYVRRQIASTDPAWEIIKDDRSRELVLANRAVLGV